MTNAKEPASASKSGKIAAVGVKRLVSWPEIQIRKASLINKEQMLAQAESKLERATAAFEQAKSDYLATQMPSARLVEIVSPSGVADSLREAFRSGTARDYREATREAQRRMHRSRSLDEREQLSRALDAREAALEKDKAEFEARWRLLEERKAGLHHYIGAVARRPLQE